MKVDIAKKRKETKVKENKDLKEELNRLFLRHIRRNNKHYYKSKDEKKKNKKIPWKNKNSISKVFLTQKEVSALNWHAKNINGW